MIEYKLYLGHASSAVPQGEVTPTGLRIFLQRYASSLEGYTLINALGFWHGVEEPTTILVVVGDSGTALYGKLYTLAVKYAEVFAQESVLMTQTKLADSRLVTPRRELVTREQLERKAA